MAGRLNDEQLATLLDPTRYVGLSAQLAEEQAAHGLEVAAELERVVNGP